MKKIVNRVIISAVVAAMAALLLAGCRERNGSATGLSGHRLNDPC